MFHRRAIDKTSKQEHLTGTLRWRATHLRACDEAAVLDTGAASALLRPAGWSALACSGCPVLFRVQPLES